MRNGKKSGSVLRKIRYLEKNSVKMQKNPVIMERERVWIRSGRDFCIRILCENHGWGAVRGYPIQLLLDGMGLPYTREKNSDPWASITKRHFLCQAELCVANIFLPPIMLRDNKDYSNRT